MNFKQIFFLCYALLMLAFVRADFFVSSDVNSIAKSPDTKGKYTQISGTLSDATKDRFFDQDVDHFDKTNNQVFKQRYFASDRFFNGSGPVFLYISGQNAANPYNMLSGFWVDEAKKFGALCVMLEHRFFGSSLPSNNFQTSNLKYLSNQQALEDLASFISFIDETYRLSSLNPWVAFGGSYAGSLAAWLRLKYPHLLYAAVSSSAPMIADLNFYEYYENINRALTNYSDTCSTRIKEATQTIQTMVKTSDGKSRLQKQFRLCDALKNQDDINFFFSSLAKNFIPPVQYNLIASEPISIKTFCNTLNNSAIGDVLARYVRVNNMSLDFNGLKCMPSSYGKMIDTLKSNSPSSSRAIFFQMCTEFGFFPTTDSPNQPFGNASSISYWLKMCSDVFGKTFTPAVIDSNIDDTNLDYGEYFYSASNVIFVNGDLDPWATLGFTFPPNNSTYAILIEGASQSADMLTDSPKDIAAITEARDDIDDILETWLTSP